MLIKACRPSLGNASETFFKDVIMPALMNVAVPVRTPQLSNEILILDGIQDMKKDGLILVNQYRTAPQYNLTGPRVQDDSSTMLVIERVPDLLVNTMLSTQSTTGTTAPFWTLLVTSFANQHGWVRQTKPGSAFAHRMPRTINDYAHWFDRKGTRQNFANPASRTPEPMIKNPCERSVHQRPTRRKVT